MQIYNISTNTYTTNTIPSLGKRGGHIGAVINGKIYYAGGIVGPNSSSCISDYSIVEYNPRTNTASKKLTKAIGSVFSSFGVVNDELYVFCGCEQTTTGGYNPTAISTCYKYNPITNTVTTMTSSPIASIASCSCVIDGSIYSIGGAETNLGGKKYNTIQVYTPDLE